LQRRIVAPVVPDPLLTDNTYDQAESGYYNIGRLTQSRNSARTEEFDYSPDGALQRTISSDAAGSHTIYNALSYNQLAYKLYYPGGLSIGDNASRWTYDGAGRLKSIPGIIKSQTYEADGQTKRIVYANGVSTEFFYNPERRWLRRIITRSPANVPLIDNSYTRDAAGRIKRIDGQTPGENWDYLYDDLDRLISADNGDNSLDETYTYDAADNMLSRSRVPGPYLYPSGWAPRPHTPLSVAGRPFSYTSNGNLYSDGLKILN
jgi:YD repeat-containing protein